MNGIDSQQKQTKIVYAPPPTDSSLCSSIYSIEIKENEEVEWQWLELPDGNRVVTDYKILRKKEIKQNLA
jgi:hypothetical protein